MPNPIFIQSNSADTNISSTSRTVVFSGAQTAGNCNVVDIAIGGTSQIINSVTDNKGNPYTLIATSPNGTQSTLWTYVAVNIAAATAGTNTVTVIMAAAVPTFAVAIREYGNVFSTGLIDGSTVATGAGIGRL